MSNQPVAATPIRPIVGGTPRVVLLQTQAEAAGAQEISRLLVDGLGRRGFNVHQVFFFRRTAAFDDAPSTYFCARERPAGIVSLARMLARLHAHLRRLKPDAVLSFQHYGNLIGAPTARLAGVRYVVANRNSARLQMPGWVRLAETVFGTVGIFSAMVVNSGSVEDEYGKHPARFRRRLVRIEHGFESKVSGATRAEARAGLGLPAGATVLGSVARLHPLKNLASAVRLLPFDAGWHLAVAGQGPERSALEALARELGCDDRLHLVGELKPEAIGTFLAALDIFVFPSVAETFGLAVVEAAGAGVPVVANRLEVLQEVLRSEGEPCALFVDANDAAAFADAVRLLVSDRELAARLTRRGRQLGSRYSLDAMVEAYATLIAAHAGKRSGAARPAA